MITQSLIEKIESYSFESEAGDLRLCIDWQQLKAEIERLEAACRKKDEDLKRLDDLCWYCTNPDIETPWRHVHEIEGRGVVAHWHHCLDPGDGLPSPCKNSDRLEEVFQEFASRFCEDHGEEVRDGCQMCRADKLEAACREKDERINALKLPIYCTEKSHAELEAACREKDERINELRDSRDERLAELIRNSELRMQAIIAQNEYYLKILAGEVALQPPAPILIDNTGKIAELEAIIERLKDEIWFASGGAGEVPHDQQDILILVGSNFQRLQELQREAERLTRELIKSKALVDKRAKTFLCLVFFEKMTKLETENAKLREALTHAVEWLSEEGCDCSNDEPGICALCEAEVVLRGEE